MDMQDKEFDEVFRAKLDKFEAEPTSQVWYGIAEGLDGKRRYRALLPWLSIAASVTVLVAAGILFIPKKGADEVKPIIKTGIAKTQTPVIVKRDSVPVPHKEIIKPAPTAINNLAHVKPSKGTAVSEPDKPETAPVNPTGVENVIKQHEQPILAAIEPQKPGISSPGVPDTQIQLIDKQTTTTTLAVTQPATTETVPQVKADAAPVKPKRRVHGIGGFLNTVIAAVDKRKDKIIEFSNSDDDESSNITAVNLGVLKFKKEETK